MILRNLEVLEDKEMACSIFRCRFSDSFNKPGGLKFCINFGKNCTPLVFAKILRREANNIIKLYKTWN